MHGEYKVTGGKLVVVDFSVVDERLTDVKLSGDFFLEPSDALYAINGALNGQPIGSSSAHLSQAMRMALGPTVQMFGFSPEDVATAVQKGLQ